MLLTNFNIRYLVCELKYVSFLILLILNTQNLFRDIEYNQIIYDIDLLVFVII